MVKIDRDRVRRCSSTCVFTREYEYDMNDVINLNVNGVTSR